MIDREIFQYLGIHQTQKYIERVKSITKTKLNDKNVIKLINVFVRSLLNFSFGITNLTNIDIILVNKQDSYLSVPDFIIRRLLLKE